MTGVAKRGQIIWDHTGRNRVQATSAPPYTWVATSTPTATSGHTAYCRRDRALVTATTASTTVPAPTQFSVHGSWRNGTASTFGASQFNIPLHGAVAGARSPSVRWVLYESGTYSTNTDNRGAVSARPTTLPVATRARLIRRGTCARGPSNSRTTE
jgi:hypothetical protein